jgi:hypothetical protein
MRPRVKLTNAKLISIQSDTEEKVERVLYGTFADENENGKEGDALFTIKVLEINGLESKCFGVDFYILDAESKEFDVNAFEFNLMHECMYSPNELDRIYLKDAYIVSVYDYKEFEKIFLGEFLSGGVIEDETFRFRPFQQIVTSKIVSKSADEDKLEIYTHSGSCYVIDADHKLIDISFVELVVMRAGAYSADRVLEMREQLKSQNKSH